MASPYAWNKTLTNDKDMFKSGAQILVNPVNCVGVMGKGLAKQFRDKFPDLYEHYKSQCKTGILKPGYSALYRDTKTEQWIANIATENHWKDGAKEKWIVESIRNLRDDIERSHNYFHPNRFQSVAIPRVGCGLGGLNWNNIRPLIIKELKGCDFDVWLDGELFLRNEKGINLMEEKTKTNRTNSEDAITIDSSFKWDKKLVADKDIFKSNAQVLINPVNCYGAMGKGLALSFQKSFPNLTTVYKRDCNIGIYKPGSCHLYYMSNGQWIANIASKDHWKYPSKEEWVIEGIKNLVKEMTARESFNKNGNHYVSIAIPKIGCGLGGLDWNKIRPKIINELKGTHYDIWLDGQVFLKNKNNQNFFEVSQNTKQVSNTTIIPERQSQKDNWRALPITEKQKEYIKIAEKDYKHFKGKTRGEAADYITEFKKYEQKRKYFRQIDHEANLRDDYGDSL